MSSWFRSVFGSRRLSETRYRREREKILASAPIPLFWLFGKTGSGKSSLVRYLTGADEAEVGSGFRPQTRTSRQFDFPSRDDPVLRFLDTRGLGEGNYDPGEDIRRFDEAAHLMVVTVRLTDQALDELVEALRQVRGARPDRPVLLCLTCLHEAYPGRQHPDPDPFSGEDIGRVPIGLQRLIRAQTERFASLVDGVVPVDLTKPGEGFDEPDFGGERLRAAILDLLPAAYRQTVLNLAAAVNPLQDLNHRRAMPYVIAHSMMAATAAAVPTPWIDIPVVMAIQTHLVYRLRSIYGRSIDADAMGKLTAAIGGRLVVRLMVREALKLIPFAGVAANSALAYAYTYGLGKASCWYFGEVGAGNAPTEEEIQRVWKQQLTMAAGAWRRP